MPMILRVEGTVSLRFRCKYITQKENFFQYPFITKNIFIFLYDLQGCFFHKKLAKLVVSLYNKDKAVWQSHIWHNRINGRAFPWESRASAT